jgi:predicted ATPase/class 3 adenylate cyclase
MSPTGQTRRVVTVVFADVSGSTALGERLDSEAVRHIMQRYSEEARIALEQHGGTVEKFIGDAVMAVFGVPQIHEDDALRAVRAVADLQERIARLSDELEREWGAGISVRMGLDTGEVVAGGAVGRESFATGDAVNVAARLEQAARPGEILLGEATRRLVRDAIRAEELEPLELRGKSAPVKAWRLVEVLPEASAFTRRIEAPFIGRVPELQTLEAAFERASQDRTCQLATVLGPPGIGKSRLARELLASVSGNAHVVVGRCLPYGEGTTFRPLVEIVQQVAGRNADALIDIMGSEEGAEIAIERIAGVTGRAEAGRPEEISWAFRKLIEALARQQPLVAFLDDIHWAESALLDLIEYIVGFASGPILVVALARPDLLEIRGSWGTPRANATTIALEPLSSFEADTLFAALPSAETVVGPARTRMIEAAEGNPLFVEQMLALHIEDPDDSFQVPPTIQALLAARIDRLESGERAVVERGSVEGRVFHRGAVAALLPESARETVGAHLMALVRKEMIRPDEAIFAGDDAFRFAHVLIRDAAYDGMPKELRADLHRDFAAWLTSVSEDRVAEYDEIVGHHLERSYRFHVELGPAGDPERALARQASNALMRAGETAIGRGDRPAQVRLLARALELRPPHVVEATLMAELGYALTELGEYTRAEEVLERAVERSAVTHDAGGAARAQLAFSRLRYSTDPRKIDEHRADAESAIAVLAGLRDELGLVRAWDFLAWLQYGQGRCSAAEAAWERSISHARRAGSRRDEVAGRSSLAAVALWGPMHQAQALRRCEEILGEVDSDLTGRALVLGLLGCLRALEGRFDEARALIAQREAIFTEVGLAVESAWHAHSAAWIEILAGEFETAECILRRGYEELERIGARTQLQVVGSYLARTLAVRAEWEEANRLASFVVELDPTAIAEVASARCTQGRAAANLGRPTEGVRLAMEGLQLIDQTEFLLDRADARMDLAEVLIHARRPEESAQALGEAQELHEQKGNAVAAERTATLLAAG